MQAVPSLAGQQEVGTANFWGPYATAKIGDRLQRWCIEHRVKRISDLIEGGWRVGKTWSPEFLEIKAAIESEAGPQTIH